MLCALLCRAQSDKVVCMTTYIFHQLGCIPGIPGEFGNCRVDIDDEGNITETPLAPIPDGDVVAEDAPEVPNVQSLGVSLKIGQETVQQPEPTVTVRTPFSTSTGG